MTCDTRDMIRQFGDGTSFIYDGWIGVLPMTCEPWYSVELGNDTRTVTGRHVPTADEAVADAQLLVDRAAAAGEKPYTSGRVVRNAPALRISIDRELVLSTGTVRGEPVEEQDAAQTMLQLEADLREALATAGDIIEAMPWDERHQAVEDALDNLFQGPGVQRDFLRGVLVHAHEFRLFCEDRNAIAALAPSPEQPHTEPPS